MNLEYPKNSCPNPIKVVHAVEDLKIGGMERVIASIVTGLDRNRFDTRVLCLTRGGAVADDLSRQGVNLTVLGIDNYHRPSQIFRLFRWLKRERCHILHCHGYFAGVAGRVAGLLARIPHMVLHVHSPYLDYQKKHLIMEKALSHWTDKIVCVSRAVQDWVLRAEEIDKGKTVIIYNGVKPSFTDTALISSNDLKDRFQIPKQDTIFSIIASLTANKGHEVLLEAFKIVSDSCRDTTLMIIGGGPMREKLDEKARRLKIDRKVVFTGEQKNIHDLLHIADICLLPSQFREGLGLALVEAMSRGLPLIGTDVGGIPEVISQGVNGLLVAPGDAEALAHAMLTLARDHALRKKMGAASRMIYEEKFTHDKMIKEIRALYDGLLG
ncbi:MAG TPA: glycosyltransferase [Syntrophales bacterium]|nr:glycosyltransferase [Syntrophales bacterium]HOM07208.1 glycosyltransferase [Syntrophales bacterium]